MALALTNKSSILIIGGGTWGCSTALHLARRGYQEVTVLDAYPIPSPISAGNDVNKMVEQGSFSDGDEEAAVANALLVIAADGWSSDPVFSPFYHDTGYIVAASSPQVLQHLNDREIRHHESSFKKLEIAEDFQSTMPPGVLTGKFPNWQGWFKPSGAGWVHARKALVSAYNEAKKLGVVFISGEPEGKVVSLVLDDGDVRGAKTADGKQYSADRIILAAGAYAPQLLDFENQLRPTAWTLGHIKMTKEEVKLYKNLPVLFNIEKGFFMEPDEDNHELKLCDEHPGYCNWVEQPGSSMPMSVPIAKNEIPITSEKRMRDFLKDCMPHLADRPFVHARVCWCVDTPNRAFLITYHPRYPSLVVASGDSGHGFMHIPSIGGFIVDCMEDKLDPRFAKSWRWRPETAKAFWGHDTLNRWGANNKILDLKDTEVDGWTEINTIL
ncbi:FAD dependent oxidoreductase [Truncatella angustata]|uniref:FAD dependent oxidoreductase n=1 Tax=Truncatella angustata TaxID=152316 RepID=A0A9P8UU11_9PEZI|nr:FAD dependent oxidoreductase [Truncatella angustata]KAH6657990.1 FAD dependent oxidoreductase [Truncatella angustata]